MQVRPIKPLWQLPNQCGFQFVGIRHDGTRATCHVITRDGACRIQGEAVYAELKGWVVA